MEACFERYCASETREIAGLTGNTVNLAGMPGDTRSAREGWGQDVVEENSMSAGSSVVPYVIAILFIGMWIIVISFAASFLSGWRDLARVYRASQPFSGERFHFQSCGMRWLTHYSGCITAGANPYGLYLSMFLPMRVGHPALFIPWTEISARTLGLGLFGRVRLQFEKCPSVPMLISFRLADRLLRASGLRFQLETTEKGL